MKKDKPFEQPKKNPMHPQHKPTNMPGTKDPMRDTEKQGQPHKPYDRKS